MYVLAAGYLSAVYFMNTVALLLAMPSGGFQPVRTGSIEPSHEVSFDQQTGQRCCLYACHQLT